MADRNPIIGQVIAAVTTAAILGVMAWAMGVFSAGSQALDDQAIEAVVKRLLVTDTGKTHAAALSELNGTTLVLISTVKELTNEVDDLEVAVLALASE